MEDKLTFERALTRLNEVVHLLDNGDLPLGESLELFLEGANLIALCNKELEEAKIKIETIFPETENTNAK